MKRFRNSITSSLILGVLLIGPVGASAQTSQSNPYYVSNEMAGEMVLLVKVINSDLPNDLKVLLLKPLIVSMKKGYDAWKSSSDNATASKKGYDYYKSQSDN